MSAACHVNFEQTLIVALVVLTFAASIAAVLALLYFRVVNQKLSALMLAKRMDPRECELGTPQWFRKIGGF